MPALVLPPSMAVVTASGLTGDGDVWANVYGVNCVLSGTPQDTMDAVDNAFEAFYNSLVTGNLVPTGWIFNKLQVKQSVVGGFGEVEKAETITSSNGISLPPQVAIVVSWKTALAGRSTRGRTYLGSFRTDVGTTGGVIASGPRTAIASAASTLISALNTAGYPLQIWSRKNTTSEDVTSASVGPYFDTQRRRRSALRG